MPSRSWVIRTLRGVGYTSRPRSAAATSASTAMTPGLGDHIERVGPLDDRGERLGVVHLDHRRAIGDTVCGRVRMPVDGHHLAAQPLESERQLTAQLAGAEQHHRAAVVALRRRLGCRATRRPACPRVRGIQWFHSSRLKPARSSPEPDIDVAPSPVLARLHGSHDGVAGVPEVFARVLMRARVAAADVTARHAHPQMRPGVLAQLGAGLALSGSKWLGFRGCSREMRACGRCSRCVRFASARSLEHAVQG